MKQTLYKWIIGGLLFISLSMATKDVHAFYDRGTTLASTHQTNQTILTIKKALISFNNSYEISINDQLKANVEGNYINLTGDTFRLMDTNNRLIASEKQIKRWGIKLNRLAEVYDANQNVTGYIGEQVIQDLFTPGYTFHFYDKNKTEIAVAKQDIFNLLDVFTIKDTQGNLLYTIKQQFNLFGNTYELTLHQTSVVPVEQAIFLTCILDAIKTSPSQSMAYQQSFQATTYRPSHFARNYLFYSMLNNWTTKRPTYSSSQTTNVNKDKTSSSTNSTAPILDLNKDKNTTNTQAENSKNNSTSNKQPSSSTNKNSNTSTNKGSSSSSTNKNSNSSSSSSKKSPNKSNTIKKPSSRPKTRR